MDLSIIIVNYNTKDLLIQCIKSITAKKHSFRYELIIVDNNSTDGSNQYLRKLQSNKQLKTVIIENKRNLGYSKANNQGIKVAKGKYILLLNSDTEVKNNGLEKLVLFAKNTPQAGVIGAKLLNPDGSTQESCFNFPTITNAIKEYWLGHKGSFGKFTPTTNGKSAITVDAVVGAAFLITNSALKKVGPLDERYFMYFEDIDYCRNVWSKGLKVFYLPTAEVKHHHGASGKKLADYSDQWKRLIPSSKIYHGTLKHYLLSLVLWTGQKWQKIIKKQ
jgi:GT2 family glycosyltransferase